MIQTSSGYFQSGLISGSTFANLSYPVTGGFVYNLFNTASTYWYDNTTPTTTNANFITGSVGRSFPTYSVSQAGIYQFRVHFDVSSILTNTGHTGSYHLTMVKNSTNIHTSSYIHLGSVSLWSYIPINVVSNIVSLTPTDKVSFAFQLKNFSSNVFTASVSSGSVYCVPVTLDTAVYITNTSTGFISGSIDSDGDGLNDTLILNSEISSILINNPTFNPSYFSGSVASSSLYSRYGDIDIPMTFQKGDLVLLKTFTATEGLNQYEYRILNSYSFNGFYYIKLNSNLPSFLNLGVYTTSSFEEVLFLRESPDETQMLLNFSKREGRTSYGLVIPENLHPDVLKNINTITKEVKTKLIETTN